jgi:hypothetical protein
MNAPGRDWLLRDDLSPVVEPRRRTKVATVLVTNRTLIIDGSVTGAGAIRVLNREWDEKGWLKHHGLLLYAILMNSRRTPRTTNHLLRQDPPSQNAHSAEVPTANWSAGYVPHERGTGRHRRDCAVKHT